MLKFKPLILLIFANDKQDYLGNIPKEASKLDSLLRSALKQTEVEVRALAFNDAISLIELVTSEQQRLVLLHFAGHSGNEFLQLDQGRLYADGFSALLKQCPRLQLLFLNGCDNQAQVKHFKEIGIPTVIGTREPINDALALQISTQFYKNLAEKQQSIGDAWDQARLALKATTGKDRSLDESYTSADNQPDSWSWFIAPHDKNHWKIKHSLQACQQLPPLPLGELPDSPYKNLAYFREADAEMFFGRCQPTLEVLSLLEALEPVLLLHGQTGVGKSSFLLAGLIPRLKASGHQVLYYRAQAKQIGNTLLKEILQIKDILQSDKLKQRWLEIEAKNKQPLHLVLDQMEELLIDPAPVSDKPVAEYQPLQRLLEQISAIFYGKGERPQGKLIISLRKEWFAEYHTALKEQQIAHQDYPLKPLNKPMIMEIIEALNDAPRLRQKYQLQIISPADGRLAEQIADDLLVDDQSSIAPTLQIILSKMWAEIADYSDKEKRAFDRPLYEKLRKQGLLLKDHLQQQINKIAKNNDWGKQAKQSGLILDVLTRHTSANGTSAEVSQKQYQQNYPHIEYRQALLESLIHHYLLIEPDNGKRQQKSHKTRLAHDTLAPLIRASFEKSDLPGQRARRILDNRRQDWQQAQTKDTKKEYLLDSHDLQRVREGKQGTKAWDTLENSLVKESLEEEKMRLKKRKQIIAAGTIAVILITGIATIATYFFFEAKKAREDIEKQQRYLATDLNEKLKEIGQQGIMKDVLKKVIKQNKSLGNDGQASDLSRKSLYLSLYADVLWDLEESSEAQKHYDQSFRINKKLAKENPSNLYYQRSLSVSYNKQGNIYSHKNQLDHALSAYRESKNIAERLVDKELDNFTWQRDLAISYGNLSNIYKKQGKLKKALELINDSLRINKILAEKKTNDRLDWKRALSVSYNSRGVIYQSQKELTKALNDFEKSILIAKKIIEGKPDNLQWQRDLSETYNNQGTIYQSQGEFTKAFNDFDKSLNIMKKLVRKTSNNTLWQIDLEFSHNKLMNYFIMRNQPKKAREHGEQALSILERLKKQGKLYGDQLSWIGIIKEALAGL